MGAPAGKLFSLNLGAAAPAGFSSPSVNPGFPSVVPIDAFQVSKVAEGRPAGANADGENVYKGLSQLAQPIQRKATSRCQRINAG